MGAPALGSYITMKGCKSTAGISAKVISLAGYYIGADNLQWKGLIQTDKLLQVGDSGGSDYVIGYVGSVLQKSIYGINQATWFAQNCSYCVPSSAINP